MRSSSRYCFSFLSCSEPLPPLPPPPAVRPEPPAEPAAPDREPDGAAAADHWLMEETEDEEEDEGWERLLWEL